MLQSRAIFALSCLVFSAAFGGLLGACGGDSGSKQPAESARDVERQATSDERDEPSEATAEADEPSDESPRRASCDDGTCARCGDGICR